MAGYKAKTESVFITGKAKWAKIFKPNEYGDWKIDVYPNPESLEIVRGLQAEGLKNVIKKDDDGYYVSFKRPTQKAINGKLVGFTPPEVLDADGKTPLTVGAIGHGSDVTVKLEVYQHSTPGGGKAKAARLAAVRVDALVPYEPERDLEVDGPQAKQVAGMADASREHLKGEF